MRNTLDSARIPRASKLLICGLFLKGRVLAQDAVRPFHSRTRWVPAETDPAGAAAPLPGVPFAMAARARRVVAECQPRVRHWRSYARTRCMKTRESERGGAAPKACSQTRRKLAKSKPSKTTIRPTPSCPKIQTNSKTRTPGCRRVHLSLLRRAQLSRAWRRVCVFGHDGAPPTRIAPCTTLRLYAALNYSPNSAHDLRRALKWSVSAFFAKGYVHITNSKQRKHRTERVSENSSTCTPRLGGRNSAILLFQPVLHSQFGYAVANRFHFIGRQQYQVVLYSDGRDPNVVHIYA